MKSILINLVKFSFVLLFAIACKKENVEVPITDFSLSNTVLTLEVDSSAILDVDIEPQNATSKSLIWSSSDTTIAKVNSEGVVTGIAPGTADITIDTKDGYGKSCKVSVIEFLSQSPIEEIELGGAPCLALDNYNNLWYSGFGYVYKMSFDGSAWILYPTKNLQVVSMAFDSKNNLWAATLEGGLLKFDGQTWSSFNTTNSEIPTNSLTAVGVDNNDNIWVGLSNGTIFGDGVAKFNGSSWKKYTTADGLVNGWVFKIIADHQNNIWFATYKGASLFDGSTWKSFITEKEYTNANIIDMKADNENNIWFASTFYGVFKYDGSKIVNYNTGNSGIGDNYIQSVGIDKKGNLWFGNYNGVIKFDGENWSNLSYPNYNIYDVRAIVVDSEGTMWLASPEKIYKLLE